MTKEELDKAKKELPKIDLPRSIWQTLERLKDLSIKNLAD